MFDVYSYTRCTWIMHVCRRNWGAEYFQAVARDRAAQRHRLRSKHVQVEPIKGVITECSIENAAVMNTGCPALEAPPETCAWSSCTSLLQHAELSAVFAEYVNKALCADSYKFLRDAQTYSDTVYTSVDAQHAAYQLIMRECILAKSPYEINISSSLRNKVSL